MRWKVIGRKLMEGIFPPSIYCIACGSVIDKTRHYALCDACIEKFHWVRESTCEKCGKRLNVEYQHTLCYDCRDLIHDFDQGYTCTQYGLYERVVMMDYKYSDKSYIGKILGDILADRMEGEPLNIDLVIPVPIHKSRGKSRGYNQAELMAKKFVQRRGVPLDTRLLVRTRKTAAMKGLGAGERKENVKDAFSVISAGTHKLKDKEILLIDDIYTTGSTVDSCARILKEAGAKKVNVLTFAAGGNVIPKE